MRIRAVEMYREFLTHLKIVDGDFCKAALEKQVYIKDELPNLMGDVTRLVVTECILQDIKSKGPDFTSAYILAKKFDTRRCPHKDGGPVSSYQCIRDLVGTENKQHFCVATQNPKLKDRMRKIPGVPIIYVNVKQQGLGLEPMTDKSKQVMKINESEKVKPLDKETLRIKRALFANEEEETKTKSHKPQAKKRKVKGVNPLAMKKKKKKMPPQPKQKAGDSNASASKK
ncbi:hypothetical protein [Parasitella parasitica]|uniref:UTP23 sensor motif region domain-containing protein n=1 Tax=Parasitella parasitica TaxID=35722 RepID=A0A0B7N812_9FUNG|nr:hypothetical protein [Parasitella parasitica]